MKAALSDIATDIHQQKKTGLLSVTVRGGNALFKIFFRGGEIYHVSCGSSKGNECLAQLDSIDLSECSFVPDIRLDIRGVNMPPTAEIIREFQGSGKIVESRYLVGDGGRSPEAVSGGRFGVISDQLKAALVRQIGPVGSKVFTKIVETKWRAPDAPTREDLLALVDFLKEEIEDLNDRNEFIRDVRRIIS